MIQTISGAAAALHKTIVHWNVNRKETLHVWCTLLLIEGKNLFQPTHHHLMRFNLTTAWWKEHMKIWGKSREFFIQIIEQFVRPSPDVIFVSTVPNTIVIITKIILCKSLSHWPFTQYTDIITMIMQFCGTVIYKM